MMIGSDTPLFLASASPRRRQLLHQLGIPIRVRGVDVDERVLPGEDADSYLVRVVNDKRDAALELGEVQDCAAVLVADTSVLIDGRILGKPSNDEESYSMLASLAGRSHTVATRYAVTTRCRNIDIAHTERTKVFFRQLASTDLDAYVRTGEGRDKAGAYGIQARGAFLVERIEGSYSNVVGLPLSQVTSALQDAGLMGALPIVAG